MSADTTTPVQPDLFGEYDARQQERAQLAQQPAACPRCGTTEPNGLLLRQMARSYQLVVKAWNAHARGKPVRTLKIMPDQKIPVVVGLEERVADR